MQVGIERGSNGRAPGRILETADLELFEHIEKNLYTAVLADSLDEIGLRDQAMRETLRPLSPDLVFAGWARTISAWMFITSPRIRTGWRSKPSTA